MAKDEGEVNLQAISDDQEVMAACFEIRSMAKQVKEAQRLLKAYDAAKKWLIAALPATEDDWEVEINGVKIEVSAPAKVRKVSDTAKLVEMLGPETFLQLAKISLGDLDKYLTEVQKSEVLTEERGSRSVSITVIGDQS